VADSDVRFINQIIYLTKTPKTANGLYSSSQFPKSENDFDDTSFAFGASLLLLKVTKKTKNQKIVFIYSSGIETIVPLNL